MKIFESPRTEILSNKTNQPFNFSNQTNNSINNNNSTNSSPASSASTRSEVDYSPRLIPIEGTDIADHNQINKKQKMTDNTNETNVTENITNESQTQPNTDITDPSIMSDESPSSKQTSPVFDAIKSESSVRHENGENSLSLDSSSANSNQKPKLTVEIPGRSSTSVTDEPHSSASLASTDTNPTNQSAQSQSLQTQAPALSASSAETFPRHSVWLTPSQAKAESKKLKGYRWIPVAPQPVTASALAARTLGDEKRQRKERKLDDELSTITQPSTPAIRESQPPALKREKTGGSTPGGRKSSSAAQFQEPIPRTQSQAKSNKILEDPNAARVRALELRLEALRRQKAILKAQSGDSNEMDDDESGDEDEDEYARNKKRKGGSKKSSGGEKRRKPSTPNIEQSMTNINSISTPTASSPGPPSYHSSYPQSSPSSTSGVSTPTISKRGRLVRTPSHFSVPEPIALSAELKRCKTLIDHLIAFKPQQGVFNEPVNYQNPALPYYAVNYIETIGGPAMDLGSIKTRLVDGGYASINDFAEDVRIVWRNAQKYNAETDWIHSTAKDMESLFEAELIKIGESTLREEERKAKRAAEKVANQNTTPNYSSQSMVDDYDPYSFDSNPPASSPLSSNFSRQSVGGRPPLGRQSSSNSSSILPSLTPQRNSAAFKAPLTQREKHLLKDDIFKLPPEKLGSVLEIIGKDPHHAHVIPADDDEVEIDIDNLQVATLRELQEFVKKTLAAQKRSVRPIGQPSPSNTNSGGTPRTSPGQNIPNTESPARTTLGTPEREITNLHQNENNNISPKQITRNKYESDSSEEEDEEEEENKTTTTNSMDTSQSQ